MKLVTKILSASLVLALSLAIFAGCSSDTDSSLSQSSEADAGSSTAQNDGTEGSDGGESAGFDYSEGIDAGGFWQGVTALDYVELFEYQAMPIPESVHAISDEQVQSEIDYLLTHYTSDVQVTDRAVVDGDTVNIDFVGSVDGVEFSGGNTQGMGADVTIGVTNYIDDFLEQLIGHMPGDTINVEVTFPENYGQENLNGQDAVFVTTINYIVEEVTPELTDEYVGNTFADSYGWTSVEEMRSEIYTDLLTSAIQSYVQEYIIDTITVSSYPEVMMDYMNNSLISYYAEYAEYYGVELEEFLETYEEVASIEELKELYREENEQIVRYYLVLQAIAEDVGMQIGEEDLTHYFTTYVGTSDYSQYEEHYGLPYLHQMALHQMVLDYISDNATLLDA